MFWLEESFRAVFFSGEVRQNSCGIGLSRNGWTWDGV